MFRIRKTQSDVATDNETDMTEVPPQMTEEVVADVASKPVVRRLPPAAIRPPASATYSPDPSRRPPLELPAFPSRGETTTAPVERTLLVGKDVRLKGEISDCDRIVIEGLVDLDVNNCKYLQVGGAGVFRGKAAVQEADVAGRFEGSVTVHERLMIRSNGHIVGKIRYGSIQIEAGGQILGDVSPIDSDDVSLAASPAQPAPRAQK